MSATATRKTVQPKTTYNYILDKGRIVDYNLRMNNFGRIIISRHHSDNIQYLVTQFGFSWLRDMSAIKVVKILTKKNKYINRTIPDKMLCEKYTREKFYSLVDLSKYSDFVAKMYAKPDFISFRSIYVAEAYFNKLNSYGHNRDVHLDPEIVTKMLGILDQYMAPWIDDQIFDFDFEDFISTGKWLTHIKTASNSGYPDNVHQDKAQMDKYAKIAVEIFNSYKIGGDINWYKLCFEEGHRTERKDKIRVICMAPTAEKIISSVFSCFMDLYNTSLPFNLPRKYGGPEEQMRELRNFKGSLITKDFDAYDTSIPIHIFTILKNWFKKYNNTLSIIIQFELDVIIHSYMAVSPNKLFWIAALPSGIGVTQFIGSLIHWLLDLTYDIINNFALYQSDDNIAKTDLTKEELNTCLKLMMKTTHMEVSPYGEKSFYCEDQGRFLQKIFDFTNNIFYNHEQRGFTNAIFRERQMSDDTVFNLLFNTANESNDNKKRSRIMHQKMVLSYLGNIVSFNSKAPSLDNILSFLYGKRSGFTKVQIEWGLSNLETYMKEYLEVEEHRAMDNPGWTQAFFSKAIDDYGWGEISAHDVTRILDSI